MAGIHWCHAWSQRSVMLVHLVIGIGAPRSTSLCVLIFSQHFRGHNRNTKRQGKSADRKGGGLAEYVVIDVQHVHKIPDTISCKSNQPSSRFRNHTVPAVEVAACIEPIAVAWHAVKRANFNEGDTAVILGGGPVSARHSGRQSKKTKELCRRQCSFFACCGRL